MTEVITISNLNKGLSIKNDPSAIPEGSLYDCIGFELIEEGILKSSSGLSVHDLGANIPSGSVQCINISYIGATKYILATTGTGLYANGVLVSAGFTGRFKAIGFMNNIYLTNGTYTKRFNGTTCYQCGISAPTSVPTFAPGSYLYKVIDSMDDATAWTATQVSCTVSAEAAIKKEGTNSLKINVAASTLGYTTKAIVVDGTAFTTGETSPEQDYIRFWLYVDSFTNLEELSLFFDLGDGTFINDYFSYTVVSPNTDEGIQAIGHGKTTEAIIDETTEYTPLADIEAVRPAFPSGSILFGTFSTSGEQGITKVITKQVTQSSVDPVILDQVFTFWRRSSLFKLKSATWTEVKIPKDRFILTGDQTKTWANVVATKIEVSTNATGAVNLYIDDLKLIGGSSLVGDYWFMYGWGRSDGDGNVLHYSSPARLSRQLIISGPVTFDRQPLTYGTRTASTDPQVNCCVIYTIGGSLSDFWELKTIFDNLTTGATISGIGDKDASKKLLSLHSEPASPGTDLVLHKNKIWLIGDPSYPHLVRSSDILVDGTLAPEAWPTRNAYDPFEKSGTLLAIDELNTQLVVKGTFGERVLQVSDPTDFLSVTAQKGSDLGLLGRDAIVRLENSHIYPSTRGFVESTGGAAKFVLPDVEPLINSTGMTNAIGVNAGLVSYFSFNFSGGERTSKIDLYQGTPRIAHLLDFQLDWMMFDPVVDKVYGVHNGNVYLVDTGSSDTSLSYSAHGEMLSYLKSRVYRQGNGVAWTKMMFSHNTNNQWFILDLYVDDILIASRPFKSTSRTKGIFGFGPVSGNDFQFTISGYRTLPIEIYFPMRIYHSAVK